MNWKLFFLILLVSVGLFGLFWYFKPKNQFLLGKVQFRSISEYVTETGIVRTLGMVGVYSPTNGVIEKIYVTNGQSVRANQKLFSVKSTATYQERADAYADFQAAKSAVSQAENLRRSTFATVMRVHDDLKNKETTETFSEKETRTIAEAANDDAYDTLVAAQARLSSAQTSYYATLNSTVYSPIEGVVTNLSVSTGSGVRVNNFVSPVSPVLLVSTMRVFEFVTAVSETDIVKIGIGQTAEIKFDAIDNKTYKALVNRFDEVGNEFQGVSKYNVYLEIVDADDQIKSGMNGDVDILTNVVDSALSVPNTAIKPYQKGRAVRVLDENNQIIFLPVKLGIKGKEFTQVLEGLNENQEIILSNPNEKVTAGGFLKM